MIFSQKLKRLLQVQPDRSQKTFLLELSNANEISRSVLI